MNRGVGGDSEARRPSRRARRSSSLEISRPSGHVLPIGPGHGCGLPLKEERAHLRHGYSGSSLFAGGIRESLRREEVVAKALVWVGRPPKLARRLTADRRHWIHLSTEGNRAGDRVVLRGRLGSRERILGPRVSPAHARLRRRNPSPDKTQGRGGWVTENCGRQRLSQLLADGGGHNEGPSETQSLRRDVRTSITGMRSGAICLPNISRLYTSLVGRERDDSI